MVNSTLADGTAHKLPADLRKALSSNKAAQRAWQNLTPLARNEWICWNIDVKQAQTRQNHIVRTVHELRQGKRRPCCWMGCVHRTDKAISPSVQWLINKKSKLAIK